MEDNVAQYLTPGVYLDPSVVLAGAQAQQYAASPSAGGTTLQQAFAAEYTIPFLTRNNLPLVQTGAANSAGVVNPVGTSTGGGTGSSSTSSPGGANKYVQFNDNGSFGGSPVLTFNKTGDSLILGDATSVTNCSILTPDGDGVNTNDALSLAIETGMGNNGGFGGDLTLEAGQGNVAGGGGAINLTSGSGGSGGSGGALLITSGNGQGAGHGGEIDIQVGLSGSTGNGRGIFLYAGNGGSGGTTVGGDIQLATGTGHGAGAEGNVVINNSSTTTSRNGGFLVIPASAGVPTGTPTSYSSQVPMVYNTTGNALYVYNSGWHTFSSPSFSDQETPSGTIDSANVTFTLAHTPSPAASLQLILNGAYQDAGGTDYTLSGATITFVTAPITGSILRAFYRY